MPSMRLVMLGEGTELSPYRADLPSYSTVSTDHENMAIIVSVTPRQGPPRMPPVGAPYWELIGGQNVLVDMPQDMLTQWWQDLARKYPDREPPYLPAFL